MRSWLDWLLTINSPDENIRRRGRNIIYIILGLLVLIAFIVMAWIILAPVSIVFAVATLIPAFTYIGMIAIVRRGYVDIAAIIIFMLQLVVTCLLYTSRYV